MDLISLNKGLLILFISVLLVFSYFTTIDRFIDGDSYHYLKLSCDGQTSQADFLFSFLIPLFNCNQLLIKAYLCLILLLILSVTFKIGKLVDKEYGELLPLILYSFTFFITEYWKFENDTTGFLIAFVAIYFALKYSYEKKHIHLLFSFILFIISSLFWIGTWYWFIALAFIIPEFIPLALFGILFFFNRIFWFLSYNTTIMEEQRFIGLIYFGVTVIFVYGILKTDRKTIVLATILVIPALFMAKLYILPLLFLSIIMLNALKMLIKNKQTLYTIVIVATLLISFFWIINMEKQFPTKSDIELVKTFVDKNGSQNSFGVGWIIDYYGGHSSSRSGYGGGVGFDYNEDGWVLLEGKEPDGCILDSNSHYLTLSYCKK